MSSPASRSLTLFGLALMVLVGALLGPGTATGQEIALGDGGVSLAGSVVNLDISIVESREPQPVEIEVLIDGRSISRQSLTPGDHSLKLDVEALTTGRHQVEVRTAAGATQTEIRVLPGWLSIVPPLVAITLALIFRNVLLSLFVGVWVGALFLFDWHPLTAAARTIDTYVLGALTTTSRAQILLFTILLGGMVGLISKSGGSQGIVDRLSKHATTPRRGQIAAWFMGILIFFDDYANTLIVGSTMRPITDRLKVSREKLAFIVDSTAAPVVSIFPISTWVGFEIGLLAAALAALDLPINAYSLFLQSIPYRFYQFLALALGLMIATGRRDFGPMLRAEQRARTTGEVLAHDATPLADYASEALTPPENAPRRAANALVPIVGVVVVTVVGLFLTGRPGIDRSTYNSALPYLRDVLGNADSYTALIWASFSGVVLALCLALGQRILSLREAMDAMVEGFKSMIMAFGVLLLAWSLGDVCVELHTADFLVDLAAGVLSPHLLPAVVFLLAAAIAFATGTSWGVLAILTPLSIPLAHGLSLGAGYSVGSDPYMVILAGTVAAVLSGSVWGDHCSPISDTTILSSMATGCDHIAHVRTQLPYALTAGGVGVILGQIPSAYGLHPFLSLLISVAVVFAIFRWFGKPVDGAPTTAN
jgi:Na+/H+ antiporter NhaC